VTPRPVDVASVQAKLRSLDQLLGALHLVGEVDAAGSDRTCCSAWRWNEP
jgi:hypothetical protein